MKKETKGIIRLLKMAAMVQKQLNGLDGLNQNIEIIWDKGNIDHLENHEDAAKRNVSIKETNEVIRDPNALVWFKDKKDDDFYFKVAGKTLAGRILLVTFTYRDGNVRPATVYPASKTIKNKYFNNLPVP